MHILSTIKPKPKVKWRLVPSLVFLLVIKPRINRGFGIILKFLLEKMLFLISLNFVIKTGQVENQCKKYHY